MRRSGTGRRAGRLRRHRAPVVAAATATAAPRTAGGPARRCE
jgi:hypothetical protein